METEEIGARIVGDYMVGPQKVGSGAFSVVWRGRNRRTGADVAIKEIDKRRLNEKTKDSLLKEIMILRQVSHPNIVRLHEALQTDDKMYLILEYCTGGDLAAYLHRHGRVTEDVARHFMRQLASGLQVLRENKIIHRDLKPQNLLLCTKDGTSVLKIGDFGFARYLMPQGLADTLCGSPLYMAPEIIQNKKYDAKADLWSVGAILFQLVTGKPPFDGHTQYQLFQNVLASDELQFPRHVMTDLHHDCVNLCKGLLRQNPVERLTFEEFFSHNFMTMPRHSGIAPEHTQNTANDSSGHLLGKSSTADVQSIGTAVMKQDSVRASTSKVSDSLESIEQGYVLVNAHFASMESVGSQLFNSLSLARVSTASEDVVECSTLKPPNRLMSLYQYAYVLTELAQKKLSAGLHLDSFSVELVALAVWKEALRVCTLWISSTVADPPSSFSSSDCLSLQKDGLLPQSLSGSLDFTKPLSVCEWVERGFILSCDRAEKIFNSFQDIDGNSKMPEAMEIIFQTALSAGKTGAVEELMGQRDRAIVSYSKAITLLMFITMEASSLLLNPPFSLSSADQQRIHRYIIVLRAHLNQSKIVEPHIEPEKGTQRVNLI